MGKVQLHIHCTNSEKITIANNSYLPVIGVYEMHFECTQLLADNYFVGSWPLFIIRLLYDDPTPSHSRQIAYENFGY